MSMRMFRAVAAAFLLAACASSGANSADQKARRFEKPQPALWALRDADSTIYLYGTLHLRRAGQAWGGPAAVAALASAREVWTEVDTDPAASNEAQASVVALGFDRTRRLSDRLDPKRRAQLAKAASDLGIPPAQLDLYQPWLASVAISIGSMAKAGYDPESGVDKALGAEARAAGKTMRWFETAQEQLSFIAGLSEKTQIQMLAETLDEVDRGPAEMTAMTTAWERGDDRALDRIVNGAWRRDYPELFAVLLKSRNARWTAALEKELSGSGVAFVAVGAAHLAGSDSVIAMLRRDGYRVERVTPPAR